MPLLRMPANRILPSSPHAAPPGMPTSASGTTAPPSTEILLYLVPIANPIHWPSGEKNDPWCALRAGEFGGSRLIQPASVQTARGARDTGDVDQPSSVGGKEDGVLSGVDGQSHVGAEVDLQADQRF